MPVKNFISKKNLLFFVLFMLYACPAAATIGLPETPVLSIAVSPFDTTIVYTGNGVGIYKSIDSEDIWTPVITGLDSTYVYDLVMDPNSSVTAYAATEEGAYITKNSGTSWSELGLSDYQVYSLCAYPETAITTNIVAGTSAGVFTSIDNGTTWTTTATGPAEIYTAVIDPTDNETLYAGSFGNGIYKSTDFGLTWSKTINSPALVRHIEINPANPATLYAAANSGVYKSTNSGASWILSLTGFPDISAYSLAIDPVTPGIVYAATDNGTFRTTNSGISWSEITVDTSITGAVNPFIRELAIDPVTPSTIYGGTYTGDIYRLSDSGSTWTQMNRELSNTTVLSIFFEPLSSKTVYASTSTLGVIKSTNAGESWTEANDGVTSYYINKVSGLPDASSLYAGTLNGLLLSSDSGVSWEPVGPSNEVYSFGIDNSTEDFFFLGSHNGIYSSLIDGTVWTAKNNGLDFPLVSCIALDPEDSDILYVGTEEDGIYKSITGGDNWEEINTGLDYHEILSLVIKPGNSSVLYAGTAEGGIFITEDSGTSWEALSSDLDNTTITSIEIFSGDTLTIYAGSMNKGFYKSTDNGTTWSIGEAAIADKSVYDIEMVPDGTQTLLLAMAGDIKTASFNTPPAAPLSPSPADEAVQQQISMTFSWTASDPDPGDTLTYDIYLEPASIFSQEVTILLTSGLTSPSYTAPILLKTFTDYRWKVVAKDGNGGETESAVWTFKTNSLAGLCISEILLIGSREKLDVLRTFRDRVLQKTASGRAIIDLYYTLSPVLQSAVEKDPELKEEYINLINSIIPFIEKLSGPAGPSDPSATD